MRLAGSLYGGGVDAQGPSLYAVRPPAGAPWPVSDPIHWSQT